MNRSPLFYPMSRGLDADVGGAADLQTDVMRFMAIISMCLVAIFALVQSIPVTTPPPDTVVEVMTPTPVEAPADARVELTRPEPEKYRPPAAERVAIERPKPAPRPKVEVRPPAAAASEPTPTASVPDSAADVQGPPEPAPKGFTLRFESDHALTRLVEQGVVGLYVVGSDGTQRLTIAGDQPGFWSASAPARFHEMDTRTVPRPVREAYQRRNPSAPADARWGVSLPAAMSAQLATFLNAHEGGDLVIGRDGTLRLEQ